ncbi:hypothetical protein N7650_27880, partial [Pseudomonas sp. GD04058]
AYAYCKGDPVNAADPTGHMPLPSPILVKGKLTLPPLSPDYIPPGSLVSTNMKAFQYFANFGGPSPTIPAAVVGSSPTGLAPAPASPLRPTSPSRQPYPSNSALPTPAGRAGPSGVVVARDHHDVDYKRVKTEIERMVPSHDAEGIVRLSTEKFHRLPVLAELRWQLMRRPGEKRLRYATRELAPKIGQRQIEALRKQAMNEGAIDKAHFYKRLHDGFTEANRKRIRKN